MHIELKARVDELSLNVKQQCIVPISIHFFKDKFWSYIVTKDVSQTKNVIIYVRPISKHSMNSVMRESSIIDITNFPSMPVKKKVLSLRLSLLGDYFISLVLRQDSCHVHLD